MKLGTRKQVAFNELREKQKRASCWCHFHHGEISLHMRAASKGEQDRQIIQKDFFFFKKAVSEQKTIYTRRISLKAISWLTHNHQQVDFHSELSET